MEPIESVAIRDGTSNPPRTLDEGFGSLDEESLQQAIKTLSGLTEVNRLIGIITHVVELKEKIARRIIIKKEAGCSRVEILV